MKNSSKFGAVALLLASLVQAQDDFGQIVCDAYGQALVEEGWKCDPNWDECYNSWDDSLAGWNVDNQSIPYMEACGQDYVPFNDNYHDVWGGAIGAASLSVTAVLALASLAF